jgi:hypothetical protein
MAAKSWEKDFRYPAMTASLAVIQGEYLDDPFRFPGSFVLPVAAKPVSGITPGRISILCLVMGFVLLGTSLFLSWQAEQNDELVFYVLAAMSGLLGLLCFFLPVMFNRLIVGNMIGPRAHDLVDYAQGVKLYTAEISSPDTKHKLTIDGDDHALLYFDASHGLLRIEGIGARYQLRAQDVSQVTPFHFMNYLGFEVWCKVGEASILHFAAATPSVLDELIRQAPILFFLKRWNRNTLYERAVETLKPA